MMLISMKNKIFQYTSKVSGNVLCSQCKRHLLFSVLITYLISKWGTGDINGMGGGGESKNYGGHLFGTKE